MQTKDFLADLNKQYLALHKTYEEYFWLSYMGDHSIDEAFDVAKDKLESFKADKELLGQIKKRIDIETDQTLINRLEGWKLFFSLYQVPDEVKDIKKQITALETKINKIMAEQDTGYTDPYTGNFVSSSNSAMSLKMRTNGDESIRKACFYGREDSYHVYLPDYVQLINLRNQYAKALGYKDFYAYKAQIEERMTSDEIFTIFDMLYEQLSPKFAVLRELEKDKPGLREPWNMSYMIAGDFTKQEDPYFSFDTILERRGRSYTAMGIDFLGGKMQLDLLQRKEKYDNGFCHSPIPTHYIQDTLIPGQVNFTTTALPGEIGSGVDTGNTLFHEGGHAAHFIHSKQRDIIYNIEFPPMSTAWAETQSMFLDTVFSSIERKMRYAKNTQGKQYPRELHEKKVHKLQPLAGRMILGIASVIDFERKAYSMSDVTKQKLIDLAHETSLKYNDFSTPTGWLLTVPHLYARDSACAYHGYGLATLALTQRREKIYARDGYVVDNPRVGEEMKKMWSYGSSKTFAALIEEATGEALDPSYYTRQVLLSADDILQQHKERVEKMKNIPFSNDIDLRADISLVHGKQTIATNVDGFLPMCEKFNTFLQQEFDYNYNA